ncbi:MAG: sugar phosphate isomerase/epimerase family protein [Desulfomonilaceae bacterium]|nr:sugar phosphate isomerase/epimerase family protein [Desulfomonilaceae bacterium]
MLYGAMNFPIRPVMSELETIVEMGFDYLELTMDPPQAHHLLIRDLRDPLTASLKQYQMGIVCHLPSFLFIADLTKSIRDASVKEMTDSLAVASELGATKVVVHPWYVSGLGTLVSDQAKQYGLEGLAVIVAKAEELGLTLCLENLFPKAGSLSDPDDFEEVLDRFPTLKITLDVGHAHIGRRRNYKSLEFIERFGRRIDHVHASDNFGKEDSHLPIGAGNIDFRKIFKALRKTGYDQTVTLEVFSRDKGYLKDSRDKLSALLARVS